jgi:hypothetical protein
LKRQRFDAVVTSPPYCNRMSYIRELRPYMYWLKYLHEPRTAGELDWRVIGGTWGIATSRLMSWQAPANGAPPDRQLRQIVRAIEAHSPLLGRYVERYFVDMALHVRSLIAQLHPGATVHYVVGNSTFYGVMVPTQELLSRQFKRAGFRETRVHTLRSRTSKRELFEYLISARLGPS